MIGKPHRIVIVGFSLFILLFMIGCDLSGARTSQPKSYSNTLNTPEEVVALFCEMDYSGKRLSGLTWSEILPYITWPDEPGWDTVLVVSKYKLSVVNQTENTADITVEYHVVGKYGTELLQMDTIERVPFKVIKTENGWKIKSPDGMLPHVSPMTLLSNLEDRLQEGQDSSISNRLRQEIAILQALQIPEEQKGLVYFLRSHNLWVHDLKAGQDRQITHDKKITTYGVSHSGRQLAYIVDEQQLYVYDLNENKEDFLFKKTALTRPSFSPKDDKLVVTGHSSAPVENMIHFLTNTYGRFVGHVWLVDIKSKKLTDLTPDSQYHHIFANWSPDGNWISYTSIVDPWWTMFKDAKWEVFLMDVNDKNHLSSRIGEGSRSQWVDNSKLAVLKNKGLKIYDMHSKRVVKEFKLEDDSCSSNYSIGKSMDKIFYVTFCGHEERRTSLIMFEPISRKKKDIIYDAEDPTFVK